LLTTKEVSSLLCIHPQTLYAWKKSGRIPHVIVNGRVRFEQNAIDDFLEKRRSRAFNLEGLLPKFDLSLDAYDKLHLKRYRKGGTSAVGKGPRRRWNYSFLGSVYQRGKHWYIDYRYLGKRIREAVKNAQTRGEAVIALQSKVAEIFNGRFNPKRTANRLTFDEFADRYMNEYAKSEKKSWRTDDFRLRRMREFFRRLEFGKITALKIREYREARLKDGISMLTANREIALLKAMFSWGVKKGLLASNPVKEIGMFSEVDTARDRVLRPDERDRLISELAPHIRPIVRMALLTGMRYRELLTLRWTDVDLEKGRIKVEHTKGKRARFIPINSVLAEVLREQRTRSSGPLVFPHKNVRTGFENACRRAEIEDFTFHDLRRTFGTQLLERGVDIVTIQKLYGHSSVLVTQRYLHPSDEVSISAVELLAGDVPRPAFEKVAQNGHKKRIEPFTISAKSSLSTN
jgi:excisionase family DNA binding protein